MRLLNLVVRIGTGFLNCPNLVNASAEPVPIGDFFLSFLHGIIHLFQIFRVVLCKHILLKK